MRLSAEPPPAQFCIPPSLSVKTSLQGLTSMRNLSLRLSQAKSRLMRPKINKFETITSSDMTIKITMTFDSVKAKEETVCKILK